KLGVDAVSVRGGASHDVALHVAAGAQRAEQAGVDAGDRLLQMALEDAVKLDALPGSEAQRAVAVVASQPIHGEVLRRRYTAARYLATDHEHVVLADALFAAGLAGIAVFLLVGAVELEQLLVLIVEMIGVRVKLFRDAAAQVPAAFFDGFDRGPIWRCSLSGRGPCRANLSFSWHGHLSEKQPT